MFCFLPPAHLRRRFLLYANVHQPNSLFSFFLLVFYQSFFPISLLLAGILPASFLPSCLFGLVSYQPDLTLPASFNWYPTRCISPFCLVQLVPYQPCPTFLLQSTAIQPNHHSPKLAYKSPPYALLQPH